MLWFQNVRNTSLGICGLQNGANHILTLSDCHPNKFTCDSGHCIELEKKCDGIVDCEDSSDELNCEFLLVKEDYTASKLPLKELEDTMKVIYIVFLWASTFKLYKSFLPKS